MAKLANTSPKFKTSLTIPISSDDAKRCEYTCDETRTIFPDRFFSTELESIEIDLARKQLGVGPETWANLSDHDRKQLCDLITEAA